MRNKLLLVIIMLLFCGVELFGQQHQSDGVESVQAQAQRDDSTGAVLVEESAQAQGDDATSVVDKAIEQTDVVEDQGEELLEGEESVAGEKRVKNGEETEQQNQQTVELKQRGEQRRATQSVSQGEDQSDDKASVRGGYTIEMDGVSVEVDEKEEAIAEQAEEETEYIRGSYPMMSYDKQTKYIVNKIKVHGVKYLDEGSLISVSGIRKGDQVQLPGDYISKAIKNFWSRRYFSDVEITGEIVGDSINLDIYFQERPVVYGWKFKGISKGQISSLNEKLALKAGNELSDFLINKYVAQIKEFYLEKAYRNVEVTPIIENDTVYKNAVTVTFDIDRKSKTKIKEINFSGNEVFSSKKLRSTLKKTRQKSINIFKSSKLKDKDYENDKESLIDFYNSKGYRNAHIVSDTIYDINKKRIGIAIEVFEGNKYYFRDITWVGNSKYETEFLSQMLGLVRGDTYDKKAMHKRLGIGKENNPDDMSITSLYQNDGYIFFQIDPAEVIIGTDSIDLELKLSEGNQATINEVHISGNRRVNDEVIRRELYTRPGDLYNRSLLMSTMRQLSQMQHFNPEAIQPNIMPVSGELVDVAWALEEQASDRAEISGGWGGGMFVGSIGLELNNLSLKRMFKKGAWSPYPQGQSQQLRIRAQSNGTYYKSFSVSFTEPWLGGKKPNSLTVSTHYSDESNATYVWQAGNKYFRTFGVSLGFGRRLNWPDQYFTLYMEASYQRYNLKDWDYFIISNGNSNIFTFTTVFGRNSVDQPVYPRRGSDFSLSVSLTPPYSLFDNHNYSDPKLPDNVRHRWIEYHKWKLNTEWYYPISSDGNLVLMARAQMGYIGSYNEHKKSPFEGFDVGGDGMSGYSMYGVDIIALRGYKNGAVTPKDIKNDYARVYNKYTLELRYPIILKPSSTIYALVFAEGGNAFTGWDKFNPFQVKRSLGVGVRLYLPVVGWIGVDWGYGFDRAVGEGKKSGGNIHYTLGMQF